MKIARLGAVLFVAATIHTLAADADDDLHVIIATTDGTHVVAELPLREEQLAGARHLWAWAHNLPPRKIELRKASPQRDEVMAELRRLPVRALAVRVRGWSRPSELASLRVIAAPTEMWATVPEPLLPTFPLSKEGRVTVTIRDPIRIRVVGEGFGTIWTDVARGDRSMDVQLRRPAADAEVTFRSSDGGPVGRTFALAMSQRRGSAAATFRAQFAGDGKEPIRIPSLPESEVITLFVTTEHTAPHTISGTASELTRTIRLPAPAEIRGRFVDEEDRPLSGVKVEAEGWASLDSPVASRGDGVSDETGQWRVRNLPRVNVIVRASAAERSVFRRRLALDEGDVDLGTIVLPRATRVALTVADADGQPLENVTIESNSGFKGRSDKAGAVTLTGLPTAEASDVTLTAVGFAKKTIELSPPLPKEEHVILERSFSVRGSVVADSGEQVPDATAVVTIGPRYRRETLQGDGTFSFEIAAGEDFELAFESPTAAAVTRKEPAGRPGEVRDLGTIRLPAGLSVRGRLTDGAGIPIADARIWVLRPSAGGVVTAWTGGRTVQTTSDAEGAFELRGLSAGPALLRIDAADFARAYRDVIAEPTPVDLGAIALTRGQTVTVNASRADAAVARLDLRGHSFDVDMLTAPVVEGKARLRHVPPGHYQVTVVDGHTIVCDRRVEVGEVTESSVECPPPTTVRGRVLLGGAPAFGGTLTWLKPGQTDALIDTRLSPMGAIQQRLYGLGGGIVAVPVRLDGSFETDQLRPGEWQVGWRSSDSVGTPDRPFTILPDAADAQIVIEFDGSVIRGRVLDKQGEPVAGARVREIQGPLHSMAATDGSFTLTGAQAGVHRLQARLGARASPVLDVNVEPGKEAPQLTLVIGDEEHNVLSIRILGVDGEPKPNAFVFAEVAGGIIKTATADMNGVATTTIAEGLPDLARLVAFADNAWAFGELRREDDDTGPQNAVIRFERTGTLRIRSETASGAPVLLSPRVPGDLGWMLSRIGSFLSVEPEAPLVIHGLPAGMYEIILGAERRVATVTAGSTATVELH